MTSGPSGRRGPSPTERDESGQQDPAAAREERARADEELLTRLRSEPVGSLAWKLFEARCADIGIRGLTAAVRGGGPVRMPGRSEHLVLSADEQQTLRTDPKELEEVVVGAVATALRRATFRIRTGTWWERGRGTALDTYFRNGCQLALAEEVKSWRRRREESGRVAPCDPAELPEVAVLHDDPEDLFLCAEDPTELLATIEEYSPVMRTAYLRQQDTGETWPEVAAWLGMHPETLRRKRKRLGEYLQALGWRQGWR